MNMDKTAIVIILFVLLLLPAGVLATENTNAQNSINGTDHYTLEVQAQPANGAKSGTNQGDHGAKSHVNLGEELPLSSCIPFACMLLSIALLPLVAGTFWHHHFGKISAFWAASLAIPFIAIYKGLAVYEILHIILADYIPFIILLWALFTVSGGILLRGTLRGTPLVNTLIILIGTLLASWMGTTGAAMLLIRPFLRANEHRKNKTFMVVFFIFLVANIGGALTPLGDPPLFLGFLHGVTFFWTLKIAPHMLVTSGILLVIYFCLDTYHYKKEKVTAPDDGEKKPLRLVGIQNFIFLGGIVGAVLMSGIADLGEVSTLGVHRAVQDWLRDGLLVVFGIASLWATPRVLREENEFSWFPIIEVAYLFIGIFITMIPCLLLLKAGPDGAFAFLINAVKQPVHYFWVTGILSAFLDNAPTYLTFFNTALGSFYAGMTEAQAVPLLMTEKAIFLQAISTGAVFFGASSYIGNAPNFMVRSIASEAGINMPSFFGYIFKYSLVFLIPTFVVVTFIFF
ncbi:MAG: sodium:proton antiporter [Proteobacteria bacterium]|nr:sodium:proton antiporter [Desulfobacula sp.]MBU3951648.1 sodium:proton antiporter [Pseudomonadota bacterium]MBU4131525.1 sodium:proton antiporter [Pseudomonadota bacterium]